MGKDRLTAFSDGVIEEHHFLDNRRQRCDLCFNLCRSAPHWAAESRLCPCLTLVSTFGPSSKS